MYPYAPEFDPSDVQENRLYSVFAYRGILFLAPLLGKKESPYAQFHAYRGINLFLIQVISYVIYYILSIVITLFSRLGGSMAFISLFLQLPLYAWVVTLSVISMMGTYYAALGSTKELPIVGKLQIIKPPSANSYSYPPTPPPY